MFHNYLKIAVRNFVKHKLYSFINICGLAIGLACALFILLWVRDEISFDGFYKNADDIYRVNWDFKWNNNEGIGPGTPPPLAATLVNEIPEVVAATRVFPVSKMIVRYEDKFFNEPLIRGVDANFFEIFDFELLSGNAQTALTEPNSVILTDETAAKYFGNAPALGKILTIGEAKLIFGRHTYRNTFKVTGIVKSPPHNSHVQFDMLTSISSHPEVKHFDWSWFWMQVTTYAKLKPDASTAAVEAKIPALVKKHAPAAFKRVGFSFDEMITSGGRWNFVFQPVTDIYLRSGQTGNRLGPTGNETYVYIFATIAVFILLIACINFMNLATARSANRAKEVGVRKVLGSVRLQLVKQFLSESVLLAFLALLIALLLIELLLPVFNRLADKELPVYVFANAGFVMSLAIVALITGLLAGVYPALVLSSFQPISVLKGSLKAGAKSPWLRSTLVVLQFAISIILLIGTGVVFKQLDYMRNKRLGFTKEQVVVLPIETATGLRNYESFRERLLQNPSFVDVAAASGVPGRLDNDTAFRPEGAPEEVVYPLQIFRGSVDLLSTLEIEMVAGRAFAREFVSDTSEACIINETAARLMGMTPESALGKTLTEIGTTPEQSDVRTIIGVVKDFHIESLHREIKPLVMSIVPREFANVIARIRPENIPSTIVFLQDKWQAFEPGYPFRYFFLDEDFGRLFRNEERQSRIFGGFTILAILIACLGLFGLASFIAEQRTKEIGIRKVLGASLAGIVSLLSKDFVKLVLLANMLAWPIGWYAMNRWLQNFSYRIEIGWGIFALAGGLAVLISLLTVSMQAI